MIALAAWYASGDLAVAAVGVALAGILVGTFQLNARANRCARR